MKKHKKFSQRYQIEKKMKKKNNFTLSLSIERLSHTIS